MCEEDIQTIEPNEVELRWREFRKRLELRYQQSISAGMKWFVNITEAIQNFSRLVQLSKMQTLNYQNNLLIDKGGMFAI